MSDARLLLVEDDPRLASLVSELLAGAGYAVTHEARGDRAAERILADPPDLVLLDVSLPGLDGFGVCRAVRARYPGRILMLTARGEEIDELIGLELGADDYLAKPVSPRRLLARVKALLRRPDAAPDAAVRTGPLTVDPRRRRVEVDGVVVPLKTAEFDLLWFLAQRLGEVVPRDVLYQELRGVAWDGVDRSMDLRVSRLRRYIGDDPKQPRWLKTVHGVGYVLVPE